MNGKRNASAVLLLCLALSAFRASADGAFSVGSNAGFDAIAGLDTLACVTVSKSAGSTAPGNFWHCAVNCSAEVADAGDPGDATLSITNGGVIVPGSERTFEMGPASPRAISTTIETPLEDFSVNHTYCCAAQEVAATDINVNDSSISAVCTDL